MIHFQSKLKGKILSNAELPGDLEDLVAHQLGWKVCSNAREDEKGEEEEEEEVVLTGRRFHRSLGVTW